MLCSTDQVEESLWWWISSGNQFSQALLFVQGQQVQKETTQKAKRDAAEAIGVIEASRYSSSSFAE